MHRHSKLPSEPDSTWRYRSFHWPTLTGLTHVVGTSPDGQRRKTLCHFVWCRCLHDTFSQVPQNTARWSWVLLPDSQTQQGLQGRIVQCVYLCVLYSFSATVMDAEKLRVMVALLRRCGRDHTSTNTVFYFSVSDSTTDSNLTNHSCFGQLGKHWM